jgi:WD40 repeat protein
VNAATYRTLLVALALALLPFAVPAADEKPPPRTDALGDPLPEFALARVGTNRFRHAGWAIMPAWSPDGKVLASGGNDNLVRLWDPATGKQVRQLAGHAGWVNGVAWTPDGKTLVTGSEDSTVRLWDPATGKELRQLAGHQEGVRALALSPDGKTAASESTDRTLRLWDLATGTELYKLAGHRSEGGTSNVAFSADGKLLASVAEGGGIVLWDPATGQEVRRIPDPDPDHSSLAFSPDGKLLAGACLDGTVRLWDPARAEEVRTLQGHTDMVTSVRFSPDGKTLLSAGSDHTLKLWDPVKGKLLRTLPGHTAAVSEVAFTADGKAIASASWDRTLRLWDAATGKPLPVTAQLGDPVSGASLSGDGKLVAGFAGQRVRLWDAATGKPVGKPFRVRGEGILSLALSGDGKLAALGVSGSGELDVCEALTGKVVQRLPGKGGLPVDLAFSRDGKRLVATEPGCAVEVWDLESGAALVAVPTEGELNAGIANVATAALSPDGQTLAWCGPDVPVRLVDVASMKPRKQFTEGVGFTVLAFSPDGRTLASAGSDNVVRLWEAHTGKLRGALTGPDGVVTAVAFSPDNRCLFTGHDGPVWVWDLDRARKLKELGGHLGPVTRAAVSADGKVLLTGGEDGTALVWDAAALGGLRKPKAAKLADKDLAGLWDALAGSDAAAAYRAVRTLSTAPDQAVPLLRDGLTKVVPAVEPERLDRLVADLDGDDFKVREKATAELEKLGRQAAPAVRKLLTSKAVSTEVRLRAQRIWEAVGDPATAPESLRLVRAVEALELAGTAEARQALEDFAAAKDAELAREAKAALARLGK